MINIEFSTIVGICALVCGFTAVSQKSDLRLRLLSATAAFIWSYHFWLLDANTTCLMSASIGIRQLIASWLLTKTKTTKLIYIVIFETLFVISTIYTWTGMTSLIPFTATALATYGFFYLTGYTLRKLMYVVGLTWLINDFVVMSWTHALATIIQLVLNHIVARKLKQEEK